MAVDRAASLTLDRTRSGLRIARHVSSSPTILVSLDTMTCQTGAGALAEGRGARSQVDMGFILPVVAAPFMDPCGCAPCPEPPRPLNPCTFHIVRPNVDETGYLLGDAIYSSAPAGAGSCSSRTQDQKPDFGS